MGAGCSVDRWGLVAEGAVLDPPWPLPGAKSGQQVLLGAGQAPRRGGRPELVGLLPVDDAASAFASSDEASARIVENRLGKRADQIAPPRGDMARPLGIRQPRGPVGASPGFPDT